MPKDIEQRMKDILVQQLCVNEEDITPGADLEDDLGADSLDCVELVMTFEDAFGIEISDEVAEGIKTVKDVHNCLIKCLS